MFQIKNFQSILAGMVNIVRGVSATLTDFNPGSVTRTLLEAPAMEIEDLYLQTYQGIMAAIPVAIYSAFPGFQAVAAVAAYGELTFARTTAADADYLIPAGTAVQTTGGLPCTTTADATLLTGATSVSVLAQCATAGTAGNVAAGSFTVLTTALDGIESVTNAAAWTTGQETETAPDKQARFAEYIAALARGTRGAVEYGARLARIAADGIVTESVRAARVIEFDDDGLQPIGTIRVVIYNGTTGASAALVAAAQRIIDGYQDDTGAYLPGWKAAGIPATVEAAAMLTFHITQSLTLGAGNDPATVQAAVEAAQRASVATLTIGQPALRAELIAAAMGVAGVVNCIMMAPLVDVAVSLNQVPVIGTITES